MTPVETAPGRRDLLVFGAALPVTVALAGFLLGRHGGPDVRTGVWVVGGAITLLYLTVPAARRRLFVAAARLTHPIGWVVSHLVLVLVFALVVTPIALLLRLLGRDPLARRADPRLPTYWVDRRPTTDVRGYFRQF
jgi:hypothetical protein